MLEPTLTRRGTERLRRFVGRRLLRWVNARAFREDFLARVPAELRSSCMWVFAEDFQGDERAVARRIESHRGRIAALAHSGELSSMPSPMAGTFELDERGRSAGAPLTPRPASAHAATGVKPRGGILLRRLVDDLAFDSVLELGTNTGMSGSYILSARRRPHLTTVEGSPDLCAVAEHALEEHSDKYRIINDRFDDAMDALATEGKRFDAVFIDGQHEERATIHYAERAERLLEPGGVLIFDDIYWSQGMLAAWKHIVRQERFRVTVDLSWQGLAIVGSGIERRLRDVSARKAHFDVCDYVGRTSVDHRDR